MVVAPRTAPSGTPDADQWLAIGLGGNRLWSIHQAATSATAASAGMSPPAAMPAAISPEVENQPGDVLAAESAGHRFLNETPRHRHQVRAARGIWSHPGSAS